jgi:hypothetical protein
VVAGLVALVALALAADAWLPEDFYVTHERAAAGARSGTGWARGSSRRGCWR